MTTFVTWLLALLGGLAIAAAVGRLVGQWIPWLGWVVFSAGALFWLFTAFMYAVYLARK